MPTISDRYEAQPVVGGYVVIGYEPGPRVVVGSARHPLERQQAERIADHLNAARERERQADQQKVKAVAAK